MQYYMARNCEYRRSGPSINMLERIVKLNNLYHPCDKQTFRTRPINVRSHACGVRNMLPAELEVTEGHTEPYSLFQLLDELRQRRAFLKFLFNHIQLVRSSNYICLD